MGSVKPQGRGARPCGGRTESQAGTEVVPGQETAGWGQEPSELTFLSGLRTRAWLRGHSAHPRHASMGRPYSHLPLVLPCWSP